MKLNMNDPPRTFDVGRGSKITLKDCARIQLEPDEQVTFLTESGAEYDVTRKSWGFYATPSLNARLKKFGWRSALVKSTDGKFYIFMLELGKEMEFQRYLDLEGHTVVCWLDQDEELQRLESKLKSE
jgi:hypothetical protein